MMLRPELHLLTLRPTLW